MTPVLLEQSREAGQGQQPLQAAGLTDADRLYRSLARRMYALRRILPQTAAAISTLHPRHPLPPDQLQVLALWGQPRAAAADGKQPGLLWLAGRWLWLMLFAVRDAFLLCFLHLRHGRKLPAAVAPAQVLIKSWRFHSRPLGPEGDFYFGLLAPQLKARGIRCATLYGDARGGIDTAFAAAVLRDPVVRGVPELLFAPVWAPLAGGIRLLGAALALRRMMRRASTARLQALCAAACRHSLKPITLRNLLQYNITHNAVRRFSARAYLSFYEGQPWEVLARTAAKAADPSCVTAGYQHTVVMPHSLELTHPPRSRTAVTAPDVVLTLGAVTQAMMAPGHQAASTRFVRTGRFREPGRASRRAAPCPEQRTLLVLPLGVIEEMVRLFSIALQAAVMLADHRIVLRCHPLLPFEQVSGLLDQAALRLPNVKVSRQADISADFAQASAVLYQASSAVLYAVTGGLKPFYLKPAPGHPTVDPLFELPAWRETVASAQALAAALRHYAASGSAAADGWEAAAEYAAQYTAAADSAAADRVAAALGFSQSIGE